MRISLLLKREPFGKILEETLKSFLLSRYGRKYRISATKKFFQTDMGQKRQIWLCNPYLNAIFIPKVKNNVFAPLIQEFWRSAKWWLRPFQKLYVLLATSQPTLGLFAGKAMEVSPALSSAESMLIIGGNHHIRLLDYNKNCAFVINKSGFPKEFLVNEIKVRQENLYLPVPKIKEVANDQSWYSEDLIIGTPINRLKDLSQGQIAIEKAKQHLFELFEKTKETIEVKGYAQGISRRIEGLIRGNKLFSDEERQFLQKDLEKLLNIINHLVSGGFEEIITIQTHGDFQAANILVNNDQVWLIDWEYTSRRQVAYDGLVYSLSSRFPQGLSSRIKKSLYNNSHSFMNDWPGVGWASREKRTIILSLFLLEELELRLRENDNSVFTNLDEGLKVFWEEMKKVILFLNKNY